MLMFQSGPKESHLIVVKRMIRYLTVTADMGLWYPSSKHLDLFGFPDSHFTGHKNARKSTSGTCQLLGNSFISQHSKKQTSFAFSTTDSEYQEVGS